MLSGILSYSQDCILGEVVENYFTTYDNIMNKNGSV